MAMTSSLQVYLHQNYVGSLTQNKYGQLKFQYSERWIHKKDAIPLSHSLPLQTESFSHKQCQGFFSGILPEETQRSLIAQNLGISPSNDFALLEAIGGECAGAITFLPPGVTIPNGQDRYAPLTESQLSEIIQILPQKPLLAGSKDIRLSLAGAQTKLAVCIHGKTISLPLGGTPSTHILKPAQPAFPGLVFNEHLCLKLAAKLGLKTAQSEIRSSNGTDYLLIQRYDREIAQETIVRLHQEDFCQALGLASTRKYQHEGGPSLKQCFALLRQVSSTPILDIPKLLDAVIFNFLIGNHDAHGKNFSLLYNYQTPQPIQLAPLYDLVSTVYYPNLSLRMAMKLGNEYESSKITFTQFDQLAQETGLSKPLVKKRVLELAAETRQILHTIEFQNQIEEAVAASIQKRCLRIQNLNPTV